jgi:ABC-type nickel/cobalt efflux system permease component RcnA
MESSLSVLVVTALGLAVFHTAVGPDHYLPFIVLGRSEGWSLRKTMLWTALCGLGHVLSSIVIGGIGIAVGWSVVGMTGVEGSRGEIASYALMGFGALYMVWGIWRARSGHVHRHVHEDGSVHVHGHGHGHEHEHEPGGGDEDEHVHVHGHGHGHGHEHDHEDGESVHVHEDGHDHDHAHKHSHGHDEHSGAHRRTLWALFVVFVLGPCEPLIPLLMVPAADHSVWGIAVVAGAFGIATIATMLAIVLAGWAGLRLIPLGPLERYVHALSGFAIAGSGAAIKFLGL